MATSPVTLDFSKAQPLTVGSPIPSGATVGKLTSQQFAAKVRAKYPDAYDSLSDDELTGRVLAKYPEYREQVNAPVRLDFSRAQPLKAGDAIPSGATLGQPVP